MKFELDTLKNLSNTVAFEHFVIDNLQEIMELLAETNYTELNKDLVIQLNAILIKLKNIAEQNLITAARTAEEAYQTKLAIEQHLESINKSKATLQLLLKVII